MAWRYIAQRAVTGEFLDMDVPIARDDMGWVLSGAGTLRGTVAPDVGLLRADDGGLLLEEWGTLLYAEADGEIRWGGIVIRSGFEEGAWRVEAAEFSVYPNGIPYTGHFSQVQMDPLDAVREIWTHVQAHPDGDLGVVVDSTTSPIRLGKARVDAYWEVSFDGGDTWVREDSVDASLVLPSATADLAEDVTDTEVHVNLKTLDHFGEIAYPADVMIGEEKVTVSSRSGLTLNVAARGVGSTSATAHYKGTAVKFTGTPRRKVDAVPAEPYELAWWDAVDCGAELGTLATLVPFDFREEHAWQEDGTISHRLRLGYPRLGRKRTDLAFEQGVNIVGDPVVAVRDGDRFANDAIGLGAGEGRKTVRVHVPDLDGRLRRPLVYTDKGVRSHDRLTALTRRELRAHRNLVEVQEITVEDHPHAPLGSWALGDDVLVLATIPWLGDVAVWSRVVGWTLLSETRAKLALLRSDSFTYGRTDS